ncbi:hypothetical protein QMU_0731, partial [Clostridioides difficile DA00310]
IKILYYRKRHFFAKIYRKTIPNPKRIGGEKNKINSRVIEKFYRIKN